MLYSDYLENLASIFGLSAINTGIIVSLLFIIAVGFITALVAKGKPLATILSGFCTMLIFTVFGWLPYWVVIMFCLIIVALSAGKITDLFTRK